MDRRPVRRAFARASRVGKPIRRAVSSAERIGLLGMETPGGDGLHRAAFGGTVIVSNALDMAKLAPSGTDIRRYKPVCEMTQVSDRYDIFISHLREQQQQWWK